jgi:hypothetical protein
MNTHSEPTAAQIRHAQRVILDRLVVDRVGRLTDLAGGAGALPPGALTAAAAGLAKAGLLVRVDGVVNAPGVVALNVDRYRVKAWLKKNPELAERRRGAGWTQRSFLD